MNRLIEFFGADTRLSEITSGDADAFCRWMRSEAPVGPDCAGGPRFGLSSMTVRLYTGYAKQFFKVALRKEIINKNPFADVKPHGLVNKERQYFVLLADAYKVLEACPDTEWQLLFALSRFGGLRCPSEIRPLKWEDVNWALDRFWVTSSKTAHHEGHEGRWVPIFTELRPYLENAFERAEPGSYVFSRRRVHNESCLRETLLRIIKRAGLSPWPKLWHNMRSTRQTELVEQGHPEHVVCYWLGNSIKVAREHYLQVTERDFRRAAKSGAPALQNPVQRSASPSRTLPKDCAEDGPDMEVMREHAPRGSPAQNGPGFIDEVITFDRRALGPGTLRQPGPESAAKSAAACSSVQELAELWPTLPEDTRRVLWPTLSESARQAIDAAQASQD